MQSMEDKRPPPYRELTVYGLPELITAFNDISPAESSTSSDNSNFETFYDPSPEKYSEDLERSRHDIDKTFNMRSNKHTFPRRIQTEPVVLIRSRQPLGTEKRPRPAIPRSSDARRNMIYTFISSTTGTNSMSLVPSVDTDDNQAQYSVTVSMNCFMPSSFITKIFHQKNVFGEFELGIMSNEVTSKVKIWGLNYVISDILSKSKGRVSLDYYRSTLTTGTLRFQGSWFWNPLGISTDYCLKWDYSIRPCTVSQSIASTYHKTSSDHQSSSVQCHSTVGDKDILAKFTSPYGLNDTGGFPLLEVTPAGQDPKLFEHILISLLIIERKRLTPDRDNNLKPLFN
ncbi:hypothetical protein CVT25_002520 [Psilocybe cyanescens]|uniref:Uncharacterized protein n=1 Tax=Psilocybe cyanescens TaxID=93625 RepID=A0A409XUC5_PSICY|nr:hypothetical protein CVT25_002520 [Psilocybe cyanescens]